MKDITTDIKLFQFANPQYLWILVIIPIFFGVYILMSYKKKRDLAKFGDLKIISRLMPEASSIRVLLKFAVMNFIMAIIILALARPQFGMKMKEIEKKGGEIIIALDVSNSMMAEDIQPNRLERAKSSIMQLLNHCENSQIGLIVFAGEAYTQIPLTSDFSAAEMFLDAVNTDMIPVQGTNISQAIELAIKSFSPNEKSSKSLIIISDGETHEQEAIDKAKEANDKGIKVSGIGMGELRAVPIPDKKTGDYRVDNQGKRVLTKLDETLLKQVTRAGGGIYTRANNSFVGLKKIYEEIEKSNSTSGTKAEVAEYDDRFRFLTAFALVFLLLEFLILERKNRWLNNIKLFE